MQEVFAMLSSDRIVSIKDVRDAVQTHIQLLPIY